MLPKSVRHIDGELWYSVYEGDNASLNYRVRKILHEEQTPYQHLMVLDTYDFGPVLVLDHILQTTTLDGFIYNEMITHMPLAIHPEPKDVLIIGGGDLGAANEAVKYDSVERVDMVEIDEAVVRLSRKFIPGVAGTGELDPRIHILYEDGVKYMAEADKQYDIIIIDSSDPVGPAVELFSQPFYEQVHKRLKPDGIMSCQSLSPVFNMFYLQHIRDVLGLFFNDVKTYSATIPTYNGGLYSFTLGLKKPPRDYKGLEPQGENRYVTPAILEKSFIQPLYVQEDLKMEEIHDV
ncbi:polyamine aminopropyltransferase [Salisediminibacterium selenitireducens]|uniref:Polyamine aminopropyltransferase n=1 Tax=Bacillus selenitireducens (strain ATCC 700615 / DSM 15326 / MLS10) TaxID=439292 RepID=D6Y0V8_BACIE|nr:polyamine aminopropyltransferase [Salisediminibacterium selenitireducens]ADI00676.1 spermidine synthase [[Bacillus] selenitireducens MLS10]